jgi:protein transport protein SEC61 subunit gamma-like protein
MEESKDSKQKTSQKAEKPKKPGIFGRLKNTFANYKRVVDIARKPEREEFISSAKITGTGIALIGAIGFIIFLLYFLIRLLWSV